MKYIGEKVKDMSPEELVAYRNSIFRRIVGRNGEPLQGSRKLISGRGMRRNEVGR